MKHKGQNVVLRSFTKDMISEEYISWLNNEEVVMYSRQKYVDHNRITCIEFYNDILKSNNEMFGIFVNDIEHVGNVTIDINHEDSVADISILIGKPSVWGKGVGYNAWTSTINYLFSQKNLRKVTGGCMANNRPMIKLMEKANMFVDGIRKNHFIFADTYVDCVFYAIFNPQFK